MSRTTLAGMAAAILLLAAQSPARAACQLTLQSSVDLAFNPNGGVLVPVRVGTRDAWIQLTLASGMAMILPAAVTELGLPTGYVRTDINLRANGQPIEREASLASLIVGNVNFAGWKMYVLPGPVRPLPMFRGRPVIGALSSQFMNVLDVELDLAGGKLNLFTHASCDGEQVYWGGEFTTEYLYIDPSGLLYFPLEIDGKRIEASLNTAGMRSRLSEAVARRHFDFKREPAAPQGRAPAGQQPLIGGRAMSMTARQLSLPNVEVGIYDDLESRCEMGYSERGSNAIGFRNCFGFMPFEIGTQLLRQLMIYIASEEKRIYITRNANAPTAAPSGGAGAAAAPSAAAGDAAVPAGDAAAQPNAVPGAAPAAPAR
jgi:hypothetical protein